MHEWIRLYNVRNAGYILTHIGWRKSMEDAILCQEITDGVYLFGVFDGHGGP
jgi:serine/threonine protein phosphatase PrpC